MYEKGQELHVPPNYHEEEKDKSSINKYQDKYKSSKLLGAPHLIPATLTLILFINWIRRRFTGLYTQWQSNLVKTFLPLLVEVLDILFRVHLCLRLPSLPPLHLSYPHHFPEV